MPVQRTASTRCFSDLRTTTTTKQHFLRVSRSFEHPLVSAEIERKVGERSLDGVVQLEVGRVLDDVGAQQSLQVRSLVVPAEFVVDVSDLGNDEFLKTPTTRLTKLLVKRERAQVATNLEQAVARAR